MRMRFVLLVAALTVALVAVSGCDLGGGDNSAQSKQKAQVNANARRQTAYIPHNKVEYNNYNNAQKLYDSPSTIIWCTTTWGNPSSPIITVPVAGKLTSSSTTFFQPTDFETSGDTGIVAIPGRSVDGMFHPNPPQYRFGFTPGGQYVDFFDMPTFCTTALTKATRQQTKVALTIDPTAQQATTEAEAALKAGTDPTTGTISSAAHAQAQKILEGASLGG